MRESDRVSVPPSTIASMALVTRFSRASSSCTVSASISRQPGLDVDLDRHVIAIEPRLGDFEHAIDQR